MANIKSSIKDIKRNARNRLRNQSVKSRMRTYVKNAFQAIEAKDPEEIRKALPEALSEIDKAASKGVIHRNSAARKKSSLERRAHAVIGSSASGS